MLTGYEIHRTISEYTGLFRHTFRKEDNMKVGYNIAIAETLEIQVAREN